VNYSQCLGIIGYSLIPLVLTAAALPLVHYFPMVSFTVKVLLLANKCRVGKVN